MSDTKEDPEIHAINTIIRALTDLDPDARSRVVGYAFHRLGISAQPTTTIAVPQPSSAPVAQTVPAAVGLLQTGQARQVDIRTFAQEKAPKSENQRIAVLAYYLAEVAPPADRKNEIGKEDITKYFKQANWPLPKHDMALINAKNAGYVEAGSNKGQYKLNAVGHNLVAHGLPPRAGSAGKMRAKGKKITGRKRR